MRDSSATKLTGRDDTKRSLMPFWLFAAAAAATVFTVSVCLYAYRLFTKLASKGIHKTLISRLFELPPPKGACRILLVSAEHGGSYKRAFEYDPARYGRGRDREEEFFTHKYKSSDSWFKKDGLSWEEHMEEVERLERMKHMQDVFHRRSRRGRSYETWKESTSKGQENQHLGRDDWYWGEDWEKWRNARERAKFRYATTNKPPTHTHHYDVLGLDSQRREPYSDAEIKAAFRAKALEYHPDRNQDKKDHAESKFRELVESYEALKTRGKAS